MNELELETLRMLVQKRGLDPAKLEDVIDERLSYRDNKKIVKEWMKAEGTPLDTRTEMVAEKELDERIAEHFEKEAKAKDEAKYEEVKARASKIEEGMRSRFDEVTKEIEDYNPHCRSITYSTLFSAMNARVGKQKTHVINKGAQGIGKSRGTSELVKRLDLPDAIIISGFMTPKKLYETLKRHRFSTVVLDESEAIMSNPDALFILRSALYGGIVAWLTSKGDTMDSFRFEGTLIANLNHFGVTDAEAQPLFDRTLFNETHLDNQKMVDKMKSMRTYKPNDEIWNLVKDRITVIRSEGLQKLTPEEEGVVMDHVEDVVKSASVFNKSMSARAVSRAKLVATCVKNLFGLGEKPWELAKELMKPYIVSEEADDLSHSLLRAHPTLTRIELTELIAEKKGISVRQASRMVKAALEKGVIVAVNRSKLRIPVEKKPEGKKEDENDGSKSDVVS